MNKVLCAVFLFFLFSFWSSITAQSGERRFEARVIEIQEEKIIEVQGKQQHYQKLKLRVTSGADEGKEIEIEHGTLPFANIQSYQLRDLVVIQASIGPEGEDLIITDYVRREGLSKLAILFVVIAVGIAGWHAIRSLLGMIVSFVIVYGVIISNILQSFDPVVATILGALLIIPITFFLSHGINKKTIVAVGATCITLMLATLLAAYAIDITNLSGYATEEASFASAFIETISSNMKGILLASMIIGLLGILDDITISQASVTHELYKTNPSLSKLELYNKAMNVGKDHIASLVNTLVLVYAGASLPLLLLFYNNPHPFTEIINYEIVADEVVRMLIGSISLILAVPITTGLSAVFLTNKSHLK